MTTTTLARNLEEARRALLDLSTRNRLLALPKPGRSRGVVIVEEEDADFVFAELGAGKAFGFESAGEGGEAAPPKKGRAKAAKAEGVAVAKAGADGKADALLRVKLSPADLTRRLRDLIADARTAREESGVPSLFLALGALAWRDPGTPGTERLAPLVLIPATLERAGVSQKFTLRADAREAQENLSLREKLLVEFKVRLPEFDADSYDPTKWAEAVGKAVEGRAEWRAEPDAIALGLFSFAKFAMWRDLDPEANPGLLENPLVRALVGGEALPPQPPAFPDDADVDAEVPVERLDHVLEVDGSQALAVEAVRRGGHLVVQGPPGTGKSQTIVNILAQAVLDGRSVLFVAEKAAALEVVKRRLDGVGLGAAVLELHSEKQSKRAVLDELRATLAAPAARAPDPAPVVRRLADLRGRLNRHAAQMRAAAGNSGTPVHEVVGRIAALRAKGEGPPPFALEGAASWGAERLRELRSAASDLAARAAEGAPNSPWRGVSPDLDALSAERLMARLPALIRALAAAPGTVAEAERAEAAAAARARFAHPAWAGDLAPLDALVRDLEAVQAARRDSRLKPSALDLQGVEEAHRTLQQPGGLLGFLNSARREAQALLARVSDDPDGVEAALRARAALARLARGGEAFGARWQGERSDASALRATLDARRAIPRGEWDRPAPTEAERAALAAWRELRDATGLEERGGFADLAERLAAWASEPEGLALWQGWARAKASAPELAPLAAALEGGSLAPDAALPAFERAALEALLRAAMRDNPALAAFDGAAMDRLVAEFREADAERVALTRALAAARHAENLAKIRAGEIPGLNILRGEFEKKRGHMPVRTLLAAAGPAVKAAKPILMMSPLSVAQFLQPTTGLRPGLRFDLLVMDEASQIEPVDALGAIARAKQMVVVGDDRQMPPTRFFQRVTSEEEGDAPEETPDAPVAAREVESVLGLANARGVPRAMLRWHYRSRHESLIATSNQEFYENRLLVLPSPRPRSPALGLSLVRVDGRFDTGGTGTNAAEAEAVAQAVLRHARETPGDTLGVAAFSVRQRDAIVEAVEKLRRESPETEPFFAAHEQEPFFVKNLENVQGDERDAILISVGYGRASDGRVAMRFGPLSAEGGERRLNVLITRAKKRCVVFSGIGAEDIDLSRAGGRGVASLKTFLGFAAASDAARNLAAEAGSPLAEAIGGVVAEAGLEAVKRVGLSGLYLDVAARDAGGYALGVETDGADWAALRCARDRDRGRQTALSGMGWRLARSWSLDWLNRPQAAAAALRAALGAVEEPARAEAAPPPADPGLAAPYAETALDGPAPTTPGGVAELLARIAATEGPIHRDAALERARQLLGPAAPDAKGLAAALQEALLLHGAAERGGFLRAEGAPPLAAPRDRRGVSLPLLRRAATVAPEEIALAARALRGVRPRAGDEELADGILRLLALEPAAKTGVMARLALLDTAATKET